MLALEDILFQAIVPDENKIELSLLSARFHILKHEYESKDVQRTEYEVQRNKMLLKLFCLISEIEEAIEGQHGDRWSSLWNRSFFGRSWKTPWQYIQQV